MTDRAKTIFGNEISAKDYQKAVSSRKKYIRKFGDDSTVNYPVYLRETPMQTRFDVAAFGILGYECNLLDLSPRKYDKIKQHAALYKKWKRLKCRQWGNERAGS